MLLPCRFKALSTISIIGIALFVYLLLFSLYLGNQGPFRCLYYVGGRLNVGWRTITASRSPIPRTLWYKVGPKGISDEAYRWTHSCILNNTEYTPKFVGDGTGDAWVSDAFWWSHPELVDIYLGLSVPIFKADILRYLLLYMEGGIYNDLDVSCETPIKEWIPDEFVDDASLVVGWEFDAGWGSNFIREFATWTIMARPRSPHIWAVIEDTMETIKEAMAKGEVGPSGVTMEMMGDVVDATGPRRFTRGVVKSVEKIYGVKILGDAGQGRTEYEELMEPKMAGDVLILPGYAFAASSNRYETGDEQKVEVPAPLVVHHYAGSWKNEKGGEF